jgi:predicted DNA-binding ribbon-helix-helix protein
MLNQTDMLIKRNLRLPDRRTSVQLEAYVWHSIDAILLLESINLCLLIAEIDQRRGPMKLASSIRLFALIYYRTLTDSMQASRTEKNMLYSPQTEYVSCFLRALQQFSRYAQHA